MLSPTIGCEPETLAIPVHVHPPGGLLRLRRVRRVAPVHRVPRSHTPVCHQRVAAPTDAPPLLKPDALAPGGDEDDVASTCDALAALPKLTHLSFWRRRLGVRPRVPQDTGAVAVPMRASVLRAFKGVALDPRRHRAGYARRAIRGDAPPKYRGSLVCANTNRQRLLG
ncbi:hypothetical protein B0H14DRAFT_1158339 [Mycena olivaceomarginata]|nr:hypothetical protein B0H14DRAFT_1158339 [Mycena olivaceomarginata]